MWYVNVMKNNSYIFFLGFVVGGIYDANFNDWEFWFIGIVMIGLVEWRSYH